jgi:hypothetical protein
MVSYRVSALTIETPVALDPFTYVSNEAEPQFKCTFSDTVIGSSLAVKCLLSAELVSKPAFAPKPVPLAPTPLPVSVKATSSETVNTIKSRAGPKIGFPSFHLAELLGLIDGSTKNRVDLIAQLKTHFEGIATKVAIEAKFKEVATREGRKQDSRWKVGKEAWVGRPVVPS